MANWYVWSGASGGATGADWTNACTTMTAALALAGYAAGDTFYVAHDHAESTASAVALTFKGTVSAVDRVICVNRSGSVPPVSADMRATATVTTTGSSNMTIGASGQFYYVDGVTFGAASGGSTGTTFSIGGALGYFKNCSLQLLSTGATANFSFGTPTSGTVPISLVFDNTSFKFSNAGQSLVVRGYNILWKNTASAILGSAPTNVFSVGTSTFNSIVQIDGCDLSGMGSGKLASAAGAPVRFVVSNCKMGSAAALSNTQSSRQWARSEFHSCDSGTKVYRSEIYDYAATLTTETTVVRSGGASDGTTAVSHKIASTANAAPLAAFDAFTIATWNSATGSSKTLTVEMVNDGVTLQNTDVWVEVEYLGDAASTLASKASSGPADSLATGSSYSTSSATWTTTGLTTPVKQSMSVSFTPQLAGFVRATVRVAKASQTLFICPKIALV